MTITTLPARRLGRSDKPFNPGRRTRANFARQCVLTEFRARDAKALLQADFVDRLPGEPPIRWIEAKFR